MAKVEKKVLLFIVEGTSDEVSFESVLDAFFDSLDVHVAVMHCDVTVQDNPNPGEIKRILAEHVHSFCRIEKINQNDIQKIIHLVDTDGAFIPSSCVIQQKSGNNLVYTESQILAPDVHHIQSRNEIKAAVLRNLCSMKTLANIPYEIYYVSRTLEHVLHNKIETLSDDEKETLSNNFDDKYAENLQSFLSFIADHSFAVPGDYKATWDFIKQKTNSLNRYSNVHLIFKTEK
jgi:predicted small metal-binding protein